MAMPNWNPWTEPNGTMISAVRVPTEAHVEGSGQMSWTVAGASERRTISGEEVVEWRMRSVTVETLLVGVAGVGRGTPQAGVARQPVVEERMPVAGKRAEAQTVSPPREEAVEMNHHPPAEKWEAEIPATESPLENTKCSHRLSD